MTVVCPCCGEERLVEQIGFVWFCQVCAKTFKVSLSPVEAVKS